MRAVARSAGSGLAFVFSILGLTPQALCLRLLRRLSEPASEAPTCYLGKVSSGKVVILFSSVEPSRFGSAGRRVREADGKRKAWGVSPRKAN